MYITSCGACEENQKTRDKTKDLCIRHTYIYIYNLTCSNMYCDNIIWKIVSFHRNLICWYTHRKCHQTVF